MSKYKIYIDVEDVITVDRIDVFPARSFYFCADGDEKGTSQELYDLLKSAGADVERVEG